MPKSIGDQELALLRFVAERGGTTVGEAVELFGVPRELARSTVLTMMERLRRKGHLTRRLDRGVFRYSSKAGEGAVLRNVVRDFVEGTLSGSVAPFVAYLADGAEVSDDELAELEDVLDRLSRKRKESGR